MLKLPLPNRRRRVAGMAVGFATALVVAGSVYAASAPPGERAAWKVHADHAAWQVQGPEYQLDVQVELSTDDGRKRHAESTALALCVTPGKAAMASVGALQVEATAVPAGDGQVRIDLAVGNAGAAPLAHNQLRGALGQTLHAAGVGGDGKQYAVDVTSQAGCPARVLAEASPVKIVEHVTNGSVRAVAESIAAKAGWTLVNPDALGHGPVSLSFDGMPAGTALQRVADLAGMKLVLDGRQVRFTPK